MAHAVGSATEETSVHVTSNAQRKLVMDEWVGCLLMRAKNYHA